jgi:hypothetical protein
MPLLSLDSNHKIKGLGWLRGASPFEHRTDRPAEGGESEAAPKIKKFVYSKISERTA